MRRALAAVALLCFASAAIPAAPAPAESPGVSQTLSAVVRDTCGKQIVLLGEATHGDGATVEFKVRLIQRLVDECGFDAVLFEASHYDFLAFSRKIRRGEAVSPEMLSSAIGGLWNKDRELEPLLPFLYARAKSGRLALGGLDDQVGSADAFYSEDEMAVELTSWLPEERGRQCSDTLRRRIYNDYSDSIPHSASEQARIRSCLAESREAVLASPPLDEATQSEQLQMLANFERAVARYPFDLNSYIRGRDLSMYVNFRWLADRLPPRSKVIIWSANAHIARDARVTGEYVAGAGNLGAYLSAAYGRRAFALGFSAASGSIYWGPRAPPRKLDPASPDSLEGQAIAGNALDAIYLGPSRLHRLGNVTGSLFSYKPLNAQWSGIVDGVVVFREQRPPRRLTP